MERAQTEPHELAFRYIVSDKEEPLTASYAELDSRCRVVGGWLEDRVPRGGRVLVLVPAGLKFIEALLGCFYAGLVAVPLQPPQGRNTLSRLRDVILDAQPAIGLTDRNTFERIQRHSDEIPGVNSLPWVLVEQLEGTVERTSRSAEGRELAMLQYTSGSTGMPKGVMLAHSNLVENAAQVHLAFGSPRRSSDGMVCWLPPFHDMGMMSGVLGPIFSGIEATILSPFAFAQSPSRWLKAIGRFGATLSGAPNFAYEQCVLRIPGDERRAIDLSAWRVAFCGAEPVRLNTLQAFAAAFADSGFRSQAFLPCYGLAEATVAVTGLNESSLFPITVSADELNNGRVVESPDSNRPLVACGPPVPGVEVQIVDPERKTLCAPDRIGEIWVKGPNVAKGYWNMPKKTETVFEATLSGVDGETYLRTGDLGFIRDRRLFVTGRAKDMLIVRGRNYYPQDLEASAQSGHESLVRGGVAAFQIEVETGDAVVIVQEVRRTARKEIEGVAEAIRAAIARDHSIVPSAVVLVGQGQLPRTTSGKIQRHACRTMLQRGELKPLASTLD